jgi:hypothetical protein
LFSQLFLCLVHLFYPSKPPEILSPIKFIMSKSSDSSEEEKDTPSKETKPNFGALTNLQPRAQRGVILPGLQPSPTKQNDEDKPYDGSKADVNNPFAGLLGIQPRGSRGGILPGLQPSPEKPKDENPSEEK